MEIKRCCTPVFEESFDHSHDGLRGNHLKGLYLLASACIRLFFRSNAESQRSGHYSRAKGAPLCYAATQLRSLLGLEYFPAQNPPHNERFLVKEMLRSCSRYKELCIAVKGPGVVQMLRSCSRYKELCIAVKGPGVVPNLVYLAGCLHVLTTDFRY